MGHPGKASLGSKPGAGTQLGMLWDALLSVGSASCSQQGRLGLLESLPVPCRARGCCPGLAGLSCPSVGLLLCFRARGWVQP